jgi:geranylgeranyl diphosphate synthase type II
VSGLDPAAWDERLRATMLAALPQDEGAGELARFARLQRDYPLRGGKGLRGRLALLSAAAHGADPDAALPVAAALELFQNWVLVHDDVEDDSETRRGRPALHRQVGVPVAINVGDAMHVAMWRLLIEIRAPWRDAVLAEVLDTIDRTAEGQHLDLAWVEAGRFDVSEAEYLAMVERKTAYYTVVAPLRLGAHVAGRRPDARLVDAGRALGRAFQIRDDVLNLLPDEDGAYGKEFAGDLYEGKRTLVLARAFARLPDGDAERLRELLDRPRSAKRPDEMRAALALLERADAIGYAQGLAEASADEGLRTLGEALQDLPGQEAARAVLDLLASLADRRA